MHKRPRAVGRTLKNYHIPLCKQFPAIFPLSADTASELPAPNICEHPMNCAPSLRPPRSPRPTGITYIMRAPRIESFRLSRRPSRRGLARRRPKLNLRGDVTSGAADSPPSLDHRRCLITVRRSRPPALDKTESALKPT
ncbi:hypothetical protein EVAR_66118_1 [Eumeta japonica]|uniref:Uncharacterized protein n=1 Tax=Eumeta variegata TaxID=151549 RepID=A0A4C2AAR7_EUMVA|nr:hypothetical protein EVAR_66118_1 [Eumeta japonica]